MKRCRSSEAIRVLERKVLLRESIPSAAPIGAALFLGQFPRIPLACRDFYPWLQPVALRGRRAARIGALPDSVTRYAGLGTGATTPGSAALHPGL